MPQQAVQLAHQGQRGGVAIKKNQIQAVGRKVERLQDGQKRAFAHMHALLQPACGNVLARQRGVLGIAFEGIDLRPGAGTSHQAGGVAQAGAQFQNALGLVLRQQLPQAGAVVEYVGAATVRLLVQACGFLQGI